MSVSYTDSVLIYFYESLATQALKKLNTDIKVKMVSFHIIQNVFNVKSTVVILKN